MPEIDIKSVMNTWTRQMNYPLISMKMNVETGLVEATQNRFLLDADHPQKSPYVSPYGSVIKTFIILYCIPNLAVIHYIYIYIYIYIRLFI